METNHPLRHHVLNRAFIIGVSLNFGFVIIEVVFGLIANSLSLIADAGHNFSDVLGLLLAWGAVYLSGRKATQKRTYGWRSSSIFAALLNAVMVLSASGGIIWEAIRRLHQPMLIHSKTIIWVASIGVIVNAISALLFWEKSKKDLNIRGAFVHLAADAAISGTVILGGVVILHSGWNWIDPLLSLAIAVVIIFGTWNLLRQSLNLALHAVPEGIDVPAVVDYLNNLAGVTSIHDLHIWAMSTTETALTVHLVKSDASGDDALINKVAVELQDRFGISHCTLQIEHGEMACANNTQCLPSTS